MGNEPSSAQASSAQHIDVRCIVLEKHSQHESFGLLLAGHKGIVYVKDMKPGGIAHTCQDIKCGDQVLEVNQCHTEESMKEQLCLSLHTVKITLALPKELPDWAPSGLLAHLQDTAEKRKVKREAEQRAKEWEEQRATEEAARAALGEVAQRAPEVACSAPSVDPEGDMETHEETPPLKIKHLVSECCRDELVLEPDWEKMLEICDRVSDDHSEGHQLLKAIYKKLDCSQPKTQFLALQLLQACMKNVAPFFRQQLVSHKKTLELLSEHATGEKNEGFLSKMFQGDDPDTDRSRTDVKELACVLIKSWAEAFKDKPAFMDAFIKLQQKGVQFPQLQAEDINYVTPPPIVPDDEDPDTSEPIDLPAARAQAELLVEIVGSVAPGTDASQLDFLNELASSVRAAKVGIQFAIQITERVEDETILIEAIATLKAIDKGLKALDGLIDPPEDVHQTGEELVEEPPVDLIVTSPTESLISNLTDQQSEPIDLPAVRARADLFAGIVGSLTPGTDASELDLANELAGSVRAARLDVQDRIQYAERVEDATLLMEAIATLKAIDKGLKALDGLTEPEESVSGTYVDEYMRTNSSLAEDAHETRAASAFLVEGALNVIDQITNSPTAQDGSIVSECEQSENHGEERHSGRALTGWELQLAAQGQSCLESVVSPCDQNEARENIPSFGQRDALSTTPVHQVLSLATPAEFGAAGEEPPSDLTGQHSQPQGNWFVQQDALSTHSSSGSRAEDEGLALADLDWTTLLRLAPDKEVAPGEGLAPSEEAAPPVHQVPSRAAPAKFGAAGEESANNLTGQQSEQVPAVPPLVVAPSAAVSSKPQPMEAQPIKLQQPWEAEPTEAEQPWETEPTEAEQPWETQPSEGSAAYDVFRVERRERYERCGKATDSLGRGAEEPLENDISQFLSSLTGQQSEQVPLVAAVAPLAVVSSKPQPMEAQPVELQQPWEAQPIEAEPIELQLQQPWEAQPIEAEPMELQQPWEAQPIEAEPVELQLQQPWEAQPIEVEPVELQQPWEAQPIEVEPMELQQPWETQPLEVVVGSVIVEESQEDDISHPQSTGWNCTACTLLNDISAEECTICGTRSPVVQQKAPLTSERRFVKC